VSTSWSPHSLAKPHEGQISLVTGDEVEATVDLEGVAVGTRGTVILANGFNWLRYRVRFANGTEVGDLDHRTLRPVGRAARRIAREQRKAARTTR
jgi:hypothetical protein